MGEVKVPFVDLKAQYQSIREEIDHAISRTLEVGQFIGGDPVDDFEGKFARYIGSQFCISCGNGTDALEITLKALGIGPGDEVIVPANSWISTAGAVSQVGADPVFVDVLSHEFNIDPDLLEAAITPKTKCIVPVHLTGMPARMPSIMDIASKYNLKVVEDCAQAHGAAIGEQKVGTFGVAGTFSFYPTKNLGAYGDGGCIVTDDPQLADQLRREGNLGQLKKHDHAFVARNSRLDTLQAAILEVKLRHLDRWNEKRHQVSKWYREYLDGQVSLQEVPTAYKHIHHLFMIKSPLRDPLRNHLQKNGILTGIHYPSPIPFTEAYAHLGHAEEAFPVSVEQSQHTISLPIYPELTEDQVKLVCTLINQFSKN